ncbi:hypothetical protein JYT83_00360 [bacterium AH-315-F18]|nr:hypothetical protein [bacterium AH-315-F18]
MPSENATMRAPCAIVVLALVVFLIAGCFTFQGPQVSMGDARFAAPPVVVFRDGDYFLRYRMATMTGKPEPSGLVLSSRKESGKAFYFFLGPIRKYERGQTIERNLDTDGFDHFARNNSVFWLDPDGTEHHLPVTEE